MTVTHPANSANAVDINPATSLARNAYEAHETLVVRYAGGDLTYGQLNDRAARLASTLADGGVTSGDRVAYFGHNSPGFLITMFASFRLGALFVPVNFRLSGAELRAVLEQSGTVVIVAEDGHRAAVDLIRESTKINRFLLIDDDPEVPVSMRQSDEWEGWSEAMAAREPDTNISCAQFDDPAILMFTSGTTGLPKGVVLTHGNLWWNSANVDSRLDTRRGETTCAAAPLFHIGALNSFVIRTIVRGGMVVVHRRFDAPTFIADLVRFEVNSVFVVPAMLVVLGRLPAMFDADLSALRSVVVAGAPVPTSLIERFAEHGIFVQQAWGLTETSPFATHLNIERTLIKLGSAGTAMPYTEVRVVNVVSNEVVAPGTDGEVVVRGPNVTPGYWQNADATAAAFDDEGWFHSGDIGHLDEDGYLFIVDRLKDMIITGGENVYPAEVERVLADMPGVIDVAVVGVPDDEWGEAVNVIAAVAEDTVITVDDLRRHAVGRLARYKLPKKLTIVECVPRNASGKLEKLVIRKMLESGNDEIS